MLRIEVIPYKNFKERIRLTKELAKKSKSAVIEVYSNYIYVEIGGTKDARRI